MHPGNRVRSTDAIFFSLLGALILLPPSTITAIPGDPPPGGAGEVAESLSRSTTEMPASTKQDTTRDITSRTP